MAPQAAGRQLCGANLGGELRRRLLDGRRDSLIGQPLVSRHRLGRMQIADQRVRPPAYLQVHESFLPSKRQRFAVQLF